MGNIIEKISTNTTTIFTSATFLTVLGYFLYEARQKKEFRELLSSKNLSNLIGNKIPMEELC
jgi:hypothetical protein